LAIDPTNHETLYVSTASGLFKTVDGGSNWSLLATATEFTEQPYAMVVDPPDPTTLYASIYLSGVFKSNDGGRTFLPMNDGLPEVLPVSSLVIDPKRPSHLYVAVGGIGPADQRAGVFATDNGGESWRAINEGLPDLLDPLLGGRLETFPLVIDPEGTFLLAATPAGVFDYEFQPELTPVRLSRPRPEAREVRPHR
jgi:photosystem II stability/assembly factor-like uncharacterized protein